MFMFLDGNIMRGSWLDFIWSRIFENVLFWYWGVLPGEDAIQQQLRNTSWWFPPSSFPVFLSVADPNDLLSSLGNGILFWCWGACCRQLTSARSRACAPLAHLVRRTSAVPQLPSLSSSVQSCLVAARTGFQHFLTCLGGPRHLSEVALTSPSVR